MGRTKAVSNDIRKVGTQSYRDLQQLNALNYSLAARNLQRRYGNEILTVKPAPRLSYLDYLWSGPVASPILTQSGGRDWVGNSIWDRSEYSLSDIDVMRENPNELRAYDQPWYALIGSGAVKMLGLAGSTFLNSTIGVITGLTQGFVNLADNKSFWEGMWNNAFTAGVEEFNRSMEEWMPNYYTLKELQGPWYENVFTANFLGDKILKNMGFTIGAIGAAYVTGGLGLGTLAGKGLLLLGAGAKAAEFGGGIINRIINGLLSATGEATVEAYNSVHDGMEKYNKELDAYVGLQARALLEKRDEDIENGISPEIAEQQYQQGLLQLDINRSKALQEYMKTLTDHGNAVFGMNVAALTISNNLEFGRAMKGGWGTQSMLESAYKKGSKDIVRKVDGEIIGKTAADDVLWGKGLAKGTSKYELVTKEPSKKLLAIGAVKNGLSEGSEEGIQRIISDTNQIRSQAVAQKESRRKGYIDYALDPKITDAMIDYNDALNHAWQESFGDGSKSGWEEVALGALTGILGVPTLGRRKSGNLGLTWQGGFTEDYRSAKENYEKLQNRVTALNENIDPLKLRNRIHSAVANVAIDQGSRIALFRDDHVGLKHALVAGAVATALDIRDNQDGGEAFRSTIEEMSTNITDKDIAEYKQAMAAEANQSEEELFAGKTTEDIRQQMLKDFMNFSVLLNKTIENHDKLSKDKRVKDKIEGFAFNELLHSYTLAQNIGERIGLIEHRNTQLNQNDPLERKEYEDNIKDLAKLREDKKYFDLRVEQALENPEEFTKLVDLKVLNYTAAINTLRLKKQVEAILKATTMELVALLLQPLSFETRESVIALAYPEATDSAKKAIDNYIKFQDDAYVVQEAIGQSIAKLDKQGTTETSQAIDNIDHIQELMNYLLQRYIERKRTERGEDLSAPYSEEQQAEDLKAFLSDTQFLNEELARLQQAMNVALSGLQTDIDANIPNLENALQQLIPVVERYNDNFQNLDEASVVVKQLIDQLYADIVFRDNIGENTSVANALRNTIDTLERDMSISPLLKQILLDTLDSLNDNEKLQSVRNAIKEQKRKFAEKREKNKKGNTKDNTQQDNTQSTEEQLETVEDNPEDSLPEDVKIFSIPQLFEYVNKKLPADLKLTPNPRISNLGIKIAVSENDSAYNESYPNYNAVYDALVQIHDLNKNGLAKVFDGTFDNDEQKKKFVEGVKNRIKTLLEAFDKGFILRESFAPEILKALNIALNDEITQWYLNYKGNDNINPDDANGGTQPDNSIPEGEENHEDKAVESRDMSGNLIHEYDMLKHTTVRDEENESETKVSNLHILHRLSYDALTEMIDDGIHTQWFIDNVLGKIFAKNPKIKVRFLTSGKSNVYLGVPLDEIKNQIPDSDEISIVEAGDKRYVIIGTCGYMKDSDGNSIGKQAWLNLRSELQRGFKKKANNSKFYADDKLYTEITNVTPGEFITTTDDENHEVYRTVKNLLQHSNPHNLKANDLTFLVIMGNEEEIVYTAMLPERADGLYRNTDATNTGGVYMYIPTGRANEWIPVMLKSVSWNDMLSQGLVSGFRNSEFYKNNILARIQTLLTSEDNVERIKAIAQLRNDLMFNKHKLGTGVTESLRLENGVVQYLNDEYQWVVINNEQEFLDALEKLNPRISINKSTLSNPKLYIDAGILLTNVKTLGTMKSTFYVRGLDENLELLEAEEREDRQYNYIPNGVKSVFYLDKKIYYNKEDGIYDEQGRKLTDEEARDLTELRSTILTGNRFNYNGRRYLISKDKQTVYLHANRSYTKLDESSKQSAVRAYEKLFEEQEKKLNRDDIKKSEADNDRFEVGDVITIVNYDADGNETHRGKATILKVFDNGGIEVEDGVQYSAQMVNKFFGKVKPFTLGAHTVIEHNSRLGDPIPYSENLQENEQSKEDNESLDNPENNDNFALVLNTLSQHVDDIMDLDSIFENAEKLLGVSNEEAQDLDPQPLLEKLAQKLDDKGVKPADMSTMNDIEGIIDNIINC